MTSTENAQSWFVLAGGQAGRKDGGGRTRSAERMRSVMAGKGAATAVEGYRGVAIPDGLTLAMGMSDVRLEKVVRLRLAIASGCYRVSATDLADKMVAYFRAAGDDLSDWGKL